jgi:hypothetical protein
VRWIDVTLPPGEENPAVALLLDQATEGFALVQLLQDRVGLDNPAVVQHMAEVGRILFRAVTTVDPEAFRPQHENLGSRDPVVGLSESDHATGYHLVVPPSRVGLPWTWLHNGLGFLLERHPLCASTTGSCLPRGEAASPWMRRYLEAHLDQQVRGTRRLRELLPHLRPAECADPEILFIPGHCREQIRRLIYREADGIRRALSGGSLGRPLASLRVLDRAVTPGLLTRRASVYQGLHFAGPTSQPLELLREEERGWLTDLLVPGETAAAEPAEAHPAHEMELEVVGVDPITALLDQISERASRHGGSFMAAHAAAAAAPSTTTWLLDDGPVEPETLSQGGRMPAFVFSNSYRSLPEFGHRFLTSGASAFIGPLCPLYSRPGRKFAGRFYSFLADGHGVAAALRSAALSCRDQFGAEHPVWLSYGAVGHGSLALQYL